MQNRSIKPGHAWLDTNGNRIHAHGGSIMYVDGTFYWYGENTVGETSTSIPSCSKRLTSPLVVLTHITQAVCDLHDVQ